MKKNKEFDNCLSWDIVVPDNEKYYNPEKYICINTGNKSAEINWGDGTTSRVSTEYDDSLVGKQLDVVYHTYNNPGRYTITITGNVIHATTEGMSSEVVCVNQWNLDGYIGCVGHKYTNGNPVPNGTWYSGEFSRCGWLEEIKEGCELPKTMKSAMGMFEHNYRLKTIPKSFKLRYGVISTAFMFNGCRELKTVNFDKFILPKSVKDAGNMFAQCKHLYWDIILWESITELDTLRKIVYEEFY